MEFRRRDRTQSIVTGWITYPGPGGAVVSGAGSGVFLEQRTDDFWKKQRRLFDPTGSGLPPSGFYSSRLHRKWTPLNGGLGSSSNWFHNYPVGQALNSNAYHPAFNKDQGDNFYVARLLARTNPTRDYFSVPVFIKELAEIALMFRFASGSFAAYWAGSYLNYKFGWSSFVADVRKLEGVVKQVLSRVREINSLIQHGGLRRSIPLDAFSDTGFSGDIYVHTTFGVAIPARATISHKQEVWGSVRWYPTDYNLIPTEPLEQWLLAVRQVFDLEMIDANTMWNLIPWSWLVDYFANVGDVFAAQEGRWLVEPRDICIMRLQRTEERGVRLYDGGPTDNIRGGNYRVLRITKNRNVRSSSVAAQPLIGLLDLDQYKVVLALIAKFRG